MSDRDIFGKLLAMLHIGALSQLGLLSNPVTGKQKADLETAKTTLDMIDMLGRRMYLDEEEKTLLDNILTELRIRYMSVKEMAEGGISPEEVN